MRFAASHGPQCGASSCIKARDVHVSTPFPTSSATIGIIRPEDMNLPWKLFSSPSVE